MDFKRMSTMRFDGHISGGYPSIYGHRLSFSVKYDRDINDNKL